MKTVAFLLSLLPTLCIGQITLTQPVTSSSLPGGPYLGLHAAADNAAALVSPDETLTATLGNDGLLSTPAGAGISVGLGGSVNVGSLGAFNGPGTGLTGTASGLTAGGAPWTGISGAPGIISSLAGLGLNGILVNTSGVITVAGASDLPSGIDAAKIGAGAVSSTAFGYLGGVTSSIQAQLNAKQAPQTSAAGYGISNGANIDTWGGKTAPSGIVVGTNDAQTLTNKIVQLADGSATAPALYWNGGTGAPLGFYRNGFNISIAGYGFFDASRNFNFNLSNGTMNVGVGAISAPAIAFYNNATTGIYCPSSGHSALVANGVNAIDASSIGCSILGTTTNDNAASGKVGEQIISTVAAGSAISLSTSTTANLTSISLTAGDWDVRYDAYFVCSAVNLGEQISSISQTSATLSAVPGDFIQQDEVETAVSGTLTHSKSTIRVSLAGTTTIYLPVQASWTGGGTISAYGSLRARRVR